jgi:acetyl-CoA acetyltransferase
MRKTYLLDAFRTPTGRFGGALATIRPADLAAEVVRSPNRWPASPSGRTWSRTS